MVLEGVWVSKSGTGWNFGPENSTLRAILRGIHTSKNEAIPPKFASGTDVGYEKILSVV